MCATTSLLSYEKVFPVIGLSVDFENGGVSLQLTVLLTDNGIFCMLEGSDNHCIDMVFPSLL